VTNNYYKEPRPARQIPTREQLEAAARRQQPSRHHIGSNAGFHPEEDEDELLDEEWPSRLPTSARRYQQIPDVSTKQGSIKVVEHYHQQPLRAHRQQLPPPRQREIYTDEVETPIATGKKRTRSIHPLLYLGVGMIAMLALVVLIFSAKNWLQEKLDDITYGNPRTSQMNFVVGHSDSAANPSHFIAINLNRHVQVIEIPGQDSTKERTFQITTLYGDGEDLTPVTLSFRDVNGDGKPDMLIHIENQTLVMINENGSFRPAKSGEVKGLL
jgi:hypothetical protein